MENLNAEQIIENLERSIRLSMDFNSEYPVITYSKLRDALALITSQEQRIKELAEEIKKWEQAYDCMDSARRELSDKCDRLTEENERLKNSITFQVVMPDDKMEEIKAECLERVELDVKECRADTVRKMQERLIAEFRKDDRMNYYLRMTLDQIAKEMLEGE